MAEDEGMHMSEEEISAILDSFRPIKEFDEDTGVFVPFMKMYIVSFVKPQQSMIDAPG